MVRMKMLSTCYLCLLIATGCASLLNPVVTMSPEQMIAQDSTYLCDAYASTIGSWQQKAAVKNELKRRNLFTEDDWARIDVAKISMKMSSLAVVCAWGFPKENNQSVGEWGTHEQWVYCPRTAYGGHTPSCSNRNYVYIENGFVSGWQN